MSHIMSQIDSKQISEAKLSAYNYLTPLYHTCKVESKETRNLLSISVFYATSQVSQSQSSKNEQPTLFKDEQPLWYFLFSERPTTFSQIV